MWTDGCVLVKKPAHLHTQGLHYETIQQQQFFHSDKSLILKPSKTLTGECWIFKTAFHQRGMKGSVKNVHAGLQYPHVVRRQIAATVVLEFSILDPKWIHQHHYHHYNCFVFTFCLSYFAAWFKPFVRQ